MASGQSVTIHKGIVKQVLSGDLLVVRGQPRGGPPPEKQVGLSNVTAPKLGRRANPSDKKSAETKDEPYAWEAREFLRKKLVGQEVCFTIEYKTPGGREYGTIFLGKDITGQNLAELMVTEGLVEVKQGGIKPSDDQQKLCQMEETAKAAGNGKWGTDPDNNHIRSIKWNIENPRNFVDSKHQKPIEAIIEHVRDGCTVRAFLLPTFHHVTVMLSGIKCPMFKQEGVAEEYAEEAKYFTESRLLQRDIKIILEGVSNQNFLGTVLHPNGNIAELLVREGFARCVDWSMGVVSKGADKLRAAEKLAKEKKLRLWKNFKPAEPSTAIKNKSFSGKVVEVVNPDCVMIKNGSELKKVYLSSIRPPRISDENQGKSAKPKQQQRLRPLYDVPYVFEAREFLREKLIGKKVNVVVDYIRPPSDDFPEKTCATVSLQGANMAEALVSRGLATVLRYRPDDDQRSSHYDDLLAAEARAQKNNKGLHSKKEPPIHRVADVTGDKAKAFLPFLQRAGRTEALVEFVASGSRLRLYLPKETCLITFLLAGISCPKMARTGPGGPPQSEPFSEEALQYTKELCLQQNVEVEVESIDKGGNFIGMLFVENANLSVNLVKAGLSKTHFTAERSNYSSQLYAAEEDAKKRKIKVWANYEEPKEILAVEEPSERKTNFKSVVVTETDRTELKFYAQHVDTGPQLEKLMDEIRSEFSTHPPLAGVYHPKKGDLCAAKFVDNQWYRARIEKIVSADKINVLYVDFGNAEMTTSSRLASLPAKFQNLPHQAHLYSLACITVPSEEDANQECMEGFRRLALNNQFAVNQEYSANGVDHVTLMGGADSKDDVGQSLISQGLALAENRREKRLHKLVNSYKKVQDAAKKDRLNIWRYGDFTEDEAAEFGYKH